MVLPPSLMLCFFSFEVTFDVVGAFCSCACRSLEPAAKPANKPLKAPVFSGQEAEITNQKSRMIDPGSLPSSPGAARMREHRWIISTLPCRSLAMEQDKRD